MFVITVTIIIVLVILAPAPLINLEDLSLLHPGLTDFLDLAPGLVQASGRRTVNGCSGDHSVGRGREPGWDRWDSSSHLSPARLPSITPP